MQFADCLTFPIHLTNIRSSRTLPATPTEKSSNAGLQESLLDGNA